MLPVGGFAGEDRRVGHAAPRLRERGPPVHDREPGDLPDGRLQALVVRRGATPQARRALHQGGMVAPLFASDLVDPVDPGGWVDPDHRKAAIFQRRIAEGHHRDLPAGGVLLDNPDLVAEPDRNPRFVAARPVLIAGNRSHTPTYAH